jgi:hypothetical protein
MLITPADALNADLDRRKPEQALEDRDEKDQAEECYGSGEDNPEGLVLIFQVADYGVRP